MTIRPTPRPGRPVEPPPGVNPPPAPALTPAADVHAPHVRCANCEARLHGRFCSQCGQDSHPSARSVGTLLHEALESITHLDGRVARTVVALLFRPGHLTAEYLDDRRARYLPPFRLYLVISILFFAVGAHDRHAVAAPPAPPTAADAALAAEACRELAFGGERIRPALVRACEQVAADGGRSVTDTFLHTLPKTMFLFLPVVALVLFALFRGSRPYYVEHLVAVLHVQSAVFVWMLAETGISALAGRLGGGRAFEAVGGIATAGIAAGLVVYVWRALRVVYDEGPLRTAAKQVVLGAAYAVLLWVTLAGTALWSVLG